MKSNHFYIIHDDNVQTIVESGGENIRIESNWIKSNETAEQRTHRLNSFEKQCNILNEWYYQNHKQYGESRADFEKRTAGKTLQQLR